LSVNGLFDEMLRDRLL